jgi:hypothetical protein
MILMHSWTLRTCSKNTQKVVRVAIKLLEDYLIERYGEIVEEMEK